MIATRSAAVGAALCLLVFVAYLPALDGGFVWDDDAHVSGNAALADPDGLRRIWLTPNATPQYYPLTHTTFWLDYRLWGLDPRGYHAVNVLLHAAAALLLWRTAALAGLPGALLAAAIFALHPIQVESVAWITERKNVLSGVFFLAAAQAFLRFSDTARNCEDGDDRGRRRRRAWYAAFIVLFLCALLSKSVTAMLPPALCAVLWWRGRLGRREAAALAPAVLLGGAYGAVTAWLEVFHVGASGEGWSLTFAGRILVAGRALWFYLGKLLWPAGLTFIYPRWGVDEASWAQRLYPLGAAALLAVLVAGGRAWGRGPAAALLFYAVVLFPALGFFNVYPMRYSFVADHFQYLAGIGPIALFAAVAARAFPGGRRAPPGRAAPARVSRAPAAAAVALVAVLGVLTWRQCGIYRDAETLWQETIRRNPGGWLAWNNLAEIRVGQNDYAAAERLYRTAAELDPRAAEVQYNLGLLAVDRRDLVEARARLGVLAGIDPKRAEALRKMIAFLAADSDR